MGFGKWIAGALGWAMFGPIGGILGFFITSSLENLSEAAAAQSEAARNQGQRNSFLMSLLVLASAVIKADGRTSDEEIANIRAFFARNFGPNAADEGERIIREVIKKDFNLDEVCAQVRSSMDYSQRLQLYYFLVSLGACDGLHKKEIEVLERIARGIGISQREADSAMAQFKPNTDSSYKILEIEPTATDDEVRKAYRKMAVKYHPDKVATLGEDVQKAAEEKFKAVAQAYEAIRKERGF